MSDRRKVPDDSLRDRMQATLVRLGHARAILNQSSSDSLEDVCAWTEAFAEELSDLSPSDCQRLQPLLLAILDELGRTISIYQSELGRLRADLTSARQGQAAGAAYRQAQKS